MRTRVSAWRSGYPEDAKAVLTDDEYLWGDSFLAAPVLMKSAVSRTTYLPAGGWWDWWSGERVEGGREVRREVDLATMPLYVRAGAVVPLGPVKQYATEKSDEPVTLRVYPGADGSFDWYEDDGESFAYRQGAFTRIHCRWSDRARTLRLTSDPKGISATGKTVRVELHGEAGGKSVRLGEKTTAVRLLR